MRDKILKNILYLIFCSLAICLEEKMFAQQMTSGLVAEWNFNVGKEKNIKDSSGNGHDGYIIGNPSVISCESGKFLCFENGARMIVPYSKDLNFKNNMSIELWINIQEDYGRVLQRMGAFNFNVSNDFCTFCICIDGQWYQLPILAAGEWEKDRWLYIVIGYGDSSYYSYLNGKLRRHGHLLETTANDGLKDYIELPPLAIQSYSSLIIGGADPVLTSVDSCKHMLQEIRVWDRLLSPEEIQEHFTSYIKLKDVPQNTTSKLR